MVNVCYHFKLPTTRDRAKVFAITELVTMWDEINLYRNILRTADHLVEKLVVYEIVA